MLSKNMAIQHLAYYYREVLEDYITERSFVLSVAKLNSVII
ncbi:MAG: putative DNA-binding protein [Colwellia sp.]|jgi:hypothetical protein